MSCSSDRLHPKTKQFLDELINNAPSLRQYRQHLFEMLLNLANGGVPLPIALAQVTARCCVLTGGSIG